MLVLTLHMWIHIPQWCSLNQIRRHHKRYLSLVNHDKTAERWGAEMGCSERASKSDTWSGWEPRRIGSTGSESAECNQSVGDRWIEPSDRWSLANPNLATPVRRAHNQDSQTQDGDILEHDGTYIHIRNASVYS